MTHHASLDDAFAALRKDLVHEDGPRISTMRNYRFALLQYDPKHEFQTRKHTQQLAQELIANGWAVLSISIEKLFHARLQQLGDSTLERLAAMEERLATTDPLRGLGYLKTKLEQVLDEDGGIAADCSRLILQHVAQHPEQAEHTVVIIGRAGALYPFFRSSALLRHLDGKTANVPVVLLYPGTRHDDVSGHTGLSFMGKLAPDNDYRPRIYS